MPLHGATLSIPPTKNREAVLPASPLGSVADGQCDLLQWSLIAVRVCQVEAEVEVGGDCTTGLLHKPDVHDLQDIVIGRVKSRQVAGGTAAAIGPGSPVQVDGITRQPIGALHDLDALYLVGLASDRVVVLFDDEQGIVVIERELGVVREGNIRVAFDQVRVLNVDSSGHFNAVGVLQVEDQDEVLGGANAVELDDDATGGCCRVKPLGATTGDFRVDIAEDILFEEPQRQHFTFLYCISSDA